MAGVFLISGSRTNVAKTSTACRQRGSFFEKNKVMTDIKKTFKKWQEAKTPESIYKREGTEVESRQFVIYRDRKYSVSRVEEPTFVNEHENFIRVNIQYPPIYFTTPIGGWVTKAESIKMAQRILLALFKPSKK